MPLIRGEEMKELKERLENLIQGLEDVLDNIEGLTITENDIMRFGNIIQRLKELEYCDINGCEQQLAELKETATSRLTQMAADEISIQILSDQLAEAKAENSHLKDKLQVTEVELEGANAYIGTIKAENEVLSKYYGQNENKTIPFLQQQIEQLKAENERLSSELSACQLALSSLQKKYLEDVDKELEKEK